MIDDLNLLYLQAPVGKGQENNPDGVEALDGRLRKVGAYAPRRNMPTIRSATRPSR